MIKSFEDIKISYDEERYKNETIYNVRKQDLYEEYPELKKIDSDIMDVCMDFFLSEEEKKQKLKVLKEKKEKFIKDNNIDTNYNEMIYTCNKCKDTGFVNNEKCDCYIKKELEIFSNISKIDKIREKCSFEKLNYNLFDQDVVNANGTKYLDYIKRVTELMKKQIDDIPKKPCNALISGSTGVGKTYLSKCMGIYAFDKKIPVLFIKMSDYIECIYNKNKNNYDSDYDLEEISKKVELLVIDDFGKEYNTEYSMSFIYDFIDGRIENNKSTIICTNFDRKDLLDIYDDGIISRIFNNYVVYKLYGKDLRGKK